jgi:hypothetical protein
MAFAQKAFTQTAFWDSSLLEVHFSFGDALRDISDFEPVASIFVRFHLSTRCSSVETP